MHWKIRHRKLDLSRHARVMGILNVTPDSFSDGGCHFHEDEALRQAIAMVAEGAEIIDVGGESTRPGARAVSADEECHRVLPVLRALRREWDGMISIDTTKAEVAEAALAEGADIINDVSGLLKDPRMPEVCAASKCGVIVMHAQGTPETMQLAPHYDDVVTELRDFFIQRLNALAAAGIDPDTLCFDPGIGFGKSLEHNLSLLAALDELAPAGRPLLLGVSRKSLIGKILGVADPLDRDHATVALTANARAQGIMLHRVHAVRAHVEALRMIEAVMAVRQQ